MNTYLKILVAAGLLGNSLTATALNDDWYIGLGGGSSWLVPNPVNPSIDDDENATPYGTVFFGRDLGNVLSAQLQLNALGDTELTNGEIVEYQSADIALLYRLYDSRDSGLSPNGFGISVYGKAVFGGIDREIGSELPLKNDGQFYFGGGVGAEMYVFGPIALRFEAVFLDQDAQYGSLSLVTRFGGTGGRTALSPPSGTPLPSSRPASVPVDAEEPTAVESSVVESTPAEDSGSSQGDTDGFDMDADGVTDDIDGCQDSPRNFPVNPAGCPLLNGVLTGIAFADGGGTLLPQSFQQLDYLAGLLQRYPQANIQVIAHTDSAGTARDQAIITRARLRTLGTYLVRKGISANRLTLRSLGGERPAYDNNSAEGRAANNRIEILERR